MATTNYATGTVVTKEWLNDVDASTYQGKLDDNTLNSTIDLYNQGGTSASNRTVANKLQEFVSVKDFGAIGNGSNDDTTAIQAALTASKKVYFPAGTYKVTSTLTAQSNSVLLGESPETTQLFRTTVYGDTLVVGSTDSHANSAIIENLWFRHIYTFNNGTTWVAGTSTSITNRDPTSAHLKIVFGQGAKINNCWFNGLGYQIYIQDSSLTWITKCQFSGLFDYDTVDLQDTTASIYFTQTTSYNVLAVIDGNHIGGGYSGAARNVTTGNVTNSKTPNVGPRYGIYIKSLEGFKITNNYIGGQGDRSIFFAPTHVVMHGAISNNFFDGARFYAIAAYAADEDYYLNNCVIDSNTYVGYGIDQGFFRTIRNTTFTTVSRLTISNNIIHYCLCSPIVLDYALAVKIANNQIAAYNSDNCTNDDVTIESGCFIYDTSNYVDSIGNTWGGSITIPGGTNYCKWGIYFQDTVNKTCGLERSNGLGIAGGTLVAGLSQTYPT